MLKNKFHLLAIFYFSVFFYANFVYSSESNEAPSCVEGSIIYFQCQSGNQKFILCDHGKKKLMFLSYKKGKLIDHIIGSTEKDFYFSNYHRFKVNQNTVYFSSEYANYEIYEYSDEELTPKMERYGVVITPFKSAPTINLSCGKKMTSKLWSLADVLKQKP